jgi:hypothetical protein
MLRVGGLSRIWVSSAKSRVWLVKGFSVVILLLLLGVRGCCSYIKFKKRHILLSQYFIINLSNFVYLFYDVE